MQTETATRIRDYLEQLQAQCDQNMLDRKASQPLPWIVSSGVFQRNTGFSLTDIDVQRYMAYIGVGLQVSIYLDDTYNLTLLPRYIITRTGYNTSLNTSDYGTRLKVFTDEEIDRYTKRLLEEPEVDTRDFVNVWTTPKA